MADGGDITRRAAEGHQMVFTLMPDYMLHGSADLTFSVSDFTPVKVDDDQDHAHDGIVLIGC